MYPIYLKPKIILFIGLVWPMAAFASEMPKKIKPDQEEPIQIKADSALFNEKAGTVIYKGHVLLEQGSRRLAADTLTIQKDAQGKIDSMIAKGNPAVLQLKTAPEKNLGYGEAKTVYYIPTQSEIILIGEAKLSQDKNIVQGSHLIYSLQKRRLVSEASPKGRTVVTLQPNTPTIEPLP